MGRAVTGRPDADPAFPPEDFGGLLPSPTGSGVRTDASAGRVPRVWTLHEVAAVRLLGPRLHEVARRGRPYGDVALMLFGEGLPVPAATILTAARARLAVYDVWLRSHHLGESSRSAEGTDGGAAFDAFVTGNPSAVRGVRRRLRGVALDPDGPDAESVVYALLGYAAGEPMPDEDSATLKLVLHSLGLHGLVEPLLGTDMRVLEGGAGDALAAVESVTLLRLISGLEEMPEDQVHVAGRQAAELGRALGAVPPAVGHHVAAPVVSALLLSADPDTVALRLALWSLLWLASDGGRRPAMRSSRPYANRAGCPDERVVAPPPPCREVHATVGEGGQDPRRSGKSADRPGKASRHSRPAQARKRAGTAAMFEGATSRGAQGSFRCIRLRPCRPASARRAALIRGRPSSGRPGPVRARCVSCAARCHGSCAPCRA